MKRIIVTGAGGQIGSELVPYLRKIYGDKNIIAIGHNKRLPKEIAGSVLSAYIDCADRQSVKLLAEIMRKHKVGIIYHLSALLSAAGETNPALAWNVNINGLFNILEAAREYKCAVFTPSSIGAFGLSAPPDNTPQDTIQRPWTMYGITKVAGELLCDYYFKKFKVDTRGVRYPGIISSITLPGGGTTDYAVHMFYEALKAERYACYIKKGTYLDMMYMPDALRAAVELMETGSSKLKHRNAFNITAMSLEPETLANEIRKYVPNFKMTYKIDPVRQAIAESWPNKMDDSAAREEWGWCHEYDLGKMTKDMIEVLSGRRNANA